MVDFVALLIKRVLRSLVTFLTPLIIARMIDLRSTGANMYDIIRYGLLVVIAIVGFSFLRLSVRNLIVSQRTGGTGLCNELFLRSYLKC